MTVIAGKLTVKLPGEAEWKDFGPGASFTVNANEKFQLKVAGDTAYLCLSLTGSRREPPGQPPE
jgi:purine/pyrimidine-nucleoside phosphorylase